ncbi:hypothetical protein [Agreia bicolorata]|nr:hypothetical protein [Agreia bicolorata]
MSASYGGVMREWHPLALTEYAAHVLLVRRNEVVTWQKSNRSI